MSIFVVLDFNGKSTLRILKIGEYQFQTNEQCNFKKSY